MGYGVIMFKTMLYLRKRLFFFAAIVLLLLVGLTGRLVYLMTAKQEYYTQKALDIEQRERTIKGKRGRILDRNGVVLADNMRVCTISVIHNQIKEPDKVLEVLCKELELSEEIVRKRIEKKSSIERIKANVALEVGQRILAYKLEGVKVDEEYKRYYPYDNLAAKVLGFTGGDNQGILGLEAMYDSQIVGKKGKITTVTDAAGREVKGMVEERKEPEAGNDLVTTLDYAIQKRCMEEAIRCYEENQASYVSILAMNPQNGEMLAMVDYPEYSLNSPFSLADVEESDSFNEEEKMFLLNEKWRNHCINDTYEPGSIFKIVTSAAALEEGILDRNERFYCPGYIVVEDRRIHCHKRTGHGSQTFDEALGNSCNPTFISIGLRLGVERFYSYFEKFGLLQKTGIDLPGEAGTIMHKKDKIGQVELATISFGQSFQISPIEVLTVTSSIVNGGKRITPHLGKEIKLDSSSVGEKENKLLEYPVKTGICSEETSKNMRELLQKVVEEGGGTKAYIEGWQIGGKTATSQMLPRSEHKYIASFLGFAPAGNPKVALLVIIGEPKGIYYGGTICAPAARNIMENILPYLGATIE